MSAIHATTKHDAAPPPVLTPAAGIAVGPLGYVAPSPAYLNLRLAWTTLNFIDDTHLLFTFHSKRLMPRLAEDPADDDDQMIHADVLDIASGKVLGQADWRMHDKGRYLWALHGGKFLVRERNSLFLTDSSLELRPYLTFDTNLQLVKISPGRTLMLIELQKILAPEEKSSDAADAQLLVPPSLKAAEETRQRRTEMLMLRPGEKTVLGKGEGRHPTDLPLLEDGFLEAMEGKKPKEWVVVKKPLGGDPQEVGQVLSACTPELVTLSQNAALAENCPVNGRSGSAISALSLASGVLWQDLWQPKYIWPTFDYAEDGSRFAYESLEMNQAMGTMDAFGGADVVAQPVGVFDTESGKLELVRNASPILSAGQNYALSADGRRFAILREGAIEVYDLPPVPAKAANDAKK